MKVNILIRKKYFKFAEINFLKSFKFSFTQASYNLKFISYYKMKGKGINVKN